VGSTEYQQASEGSDPEVIKPLDAVTVVVMANRLDSITREMTNTVVRAARSTTMAARDFSCCIVSANHELLSCPEGLPAHVFGMGLSARSMAELHSDFREGDAFLHNDPYMGGSHAADHQILVPVFVNGEHLFTAGIKAHQVDCGNALPTTYMPMARDVYEEGALIFPCVKVQTNYEDVADVIRMCERRIRGFDIWYGDYLAQLGAARLAERRLKEFCAKFGVDTVKRFIAEWLDYSERVTADAISMLPSGRAVGETCVDPFPGLPDGIPLRATIDVNAEEGRVLVDLRDNPDCVPAGLNLTETTSRSAGIAAVLTVLNSKSNAKRVIVPNNEGSFRRIDVLLRENCVAGVPRHPVSCSVSTNTVADRVVGMIMSAFASLGDTVGLGEPCYGSPPFMAVVSGMDRRRKNFYIFQLVSGTGGGPGSSESDGWLMLLLAGGGGLVYMDSIELVEQNYPLVIWEKALRVDSEGAGAKRGAPGNVCVYGPRFDAMEAHYFLEGVVNRPRGVRGGGSALGPAACIVRSGGSWEPRRETIGKAVVDPGEAIVSLSAGGGGYGVPLARDPGLVLEDVIEGWISATRAREAYGVVLSGNAELWETVTVDEGATEAERRRLWSVRATEPADGYRRPQEKLDWWAGAKIDGGLGG
jgi:N-methylhydantoinase B